MDLTPSQQRVIHFPFNEATTLEVQAGPGSGKTWTLLNKVYHLIEEQHVKADEILILSLTNKAVDNIVEKLLGVYLGKEGQGHLPRIEEKVDQIGIYTIHGMANRIVVENDGIINIIEENGWRGLTKLLPALRSNGDKNKEALTESINPKLLERLLQNYKVKKDNNANSSARDALAEMVKIMKECKVLTNEDLILRAMELLNEKVRSDTSASEDFTSQLLNKFKVVLIDEVQDLYPLLSPLITQVVKGKQLIMFGDTNQSIYEFMGHNESVIKDLREIHKAEQSQTFHLYDNFRNTPEIIQTATQVLRASKRKTFETSELILKEKTDVQPQLINFTNTTAQLDFLSAEITKLVCASARFNDISILSRTHEHLQTIAQHLSAYNIPYEKLTSQPDWIRDPRIQFITDILKVVVLTGDSHWQSDFSIIVTLGALRGVGSRTLQTLYSTSTLANMTLWRYITEVTRKQWGTVITNKLKIEEYVQILRPVVESRVYSQMNDPIEILTELCEMVYRLDCPLFQFKSRQEIDDFQASLEQMLTVLKLCSTNKPEGISLVKWFLETYFDQSGIYHHTRLASEATGIGSVKLSTIHSSKGLEFPISFVVGNPRGNNFPMDDNTLYVGMTRARNLLYLVNVNHPRIVPWEFKPPVNIIEQPKFWEYYNRDLARSWTPKQTNKMAYQTLSNKYGLRQYSTCCRHLRRCFKVLR
ncbi:ATP-dependent 3'-5' DNA helicase KNAG_0K00730 [Huiozyma naganishii CBS 8797]|uniref:DNA 3'-5' helicase n=1 Tax=Huiozyma naganishii (strain ATCC MYA-139 / BCRC 22969 / CBS 8797 / KCTC 17520 / NBRC 10181 / NCYC 3082 / Yp74L-3) TaxID=1071383 RepID=J7SAS3_HUIN7|nr:hypothetical protein KNAG_0K00730 [Kazachstania naganishii CBS 8797]CCK72441.1 hypothetical protein KNAG_0K00730 [Kazachstania naganishii CBS 8797]